MLPVSAIIPVSLPIRKPVIQTFGLKLTEYRTGRRIANPIQ